MQEAFSLSTIETIVACYLIDQYIDCSDKFWHIKTLLLRHIAGNTLTKESDLVNILQAIKGLPCFHSLVLAEDIDPGTGIRYVVYRVTDSWVNSEIAEEEE